MISAVRTAERRAVVGLLVLFAASRALYALVGVRFRAPMPFFGLHVIDHRLLEHDLWASVWHQHTQPPLFNLVLGVVLHLPGSTPVLLQGLYLATGVALTLTMFFLMRELGVPAPWAFAATGLFTVLPVTVLYENYLYSTYPIAFLLVVSGLFLARFLRTRRSLDGLLLSVALTLLVLTRSTYHLAWLLAVVAGVLLLARPDRRALAVTLIPAVLAIGWYAKTWVEFGTFTTSSWAGMNLAKVTLQQAPPREIKELVRRGELSPQALTPTFSPPETYKPLPPRTGVAVLDERRKSTRDEANYHHRVYVDVGARYLDDSVRFIRAHPFEYARMVQYSFRLFWLPGSDMSMGEPNQLHVDGLDRVVNRFLFLQPDSYYSTEARGFVRPVSAYAPGPGQLAWGAVVVYFTAWAGSAAAAWALLCRKQIMNRTRAVIVAFLGLTVFYVTVVANMFELGENNRFRFETDAAVWVVFVAMFAAILRRWRVRMGPSETQKPRLGRLPVSWPRASQ